MTDDAKTSTTDQPIDPQDRVLDWIPRFDPRSLDHKVSVKIEEQRGITVRTPRNVRWTRKAWLDQGREGACTGFGLSHTLAATPRPRPGVDNAFAHERYVRARQKDQWPGENYDGSSVLGAMAAAKEDGLITDYWWCTTIEEIDTALSWLGQIEIGVDWTSGMFTPDSDGFITHSGTVEGGHAPAIGGRKVMPNGRVRYTLDNSWGKTWGRDGSAYLWQDTLEWWLSRSSEFAVPRKVRPTRS